jgi:hypothetical protein
MSNESLMRELDAWARTAANIFPDVSTCPHYTRCNASGRNPNGILNGKNCMMSYVGRKYRKDGIFPLVIVGLDHGDRCKASYDQRRTGIESHFQQGAGAFNDHYAGVVKTAAAILGGAAQRCARDCDKSCQKSRNSSALCVLDCIAQPNLVKCVRDDAETRRFIATSEMMANCVGHLVDELTRLRPKLVVFHGARAGWAVGQAIDSLKPIENVTDPPVLYEWPTSGAHLLFLRHPSFGHLKAQWDTVVLKALDYLRGRSLIPD